jgi:hypothetical protein
MEIKFLLPNRKVVNSPYNFNEYYQSENFNYYLRLKALEYHSKFVKDIKTMRKIKGVQIEMFSKELLLKLSEGLYKASKSKDYKLPLLI